MVDMTSLPYKINHTNLEHSFNYYVTLLNLEKSLNLNHELKHAYSTFKTD